MPQFVARRAAQHFANIVRTFLDDPARWMKRGPRSITWPASPPDLIFSCGDLLRTTSTEQVGDLADLQQIIYAAVNNVTLQMLKNTWVKVEYLLDISRATNGSHVEVYET